MTRLSALLLLVTLLGSQPAPATADVTRETDRFTGQRTVSIDHPLPTRWGRPELMAMALVERRAP